MISGELVPKTKVSFMKYSLVAAAFFALVAGSAHAEVVGLQFDKMPVGTKLITETRDADPQQYAETYVGKKGDVYVIERSKIKSDGTEPLILVQHYDEKGRLIRKEKDGKMNSTHTPFSCAYVLDRCEHTYVYADPFKSGKLDTLKDVYRNQLDGKVLTVAKQLADGSYMEIPYELGPYNLRISSEYTDADGQTQGYKLIEIIEP